MKVASRQAQHMDVLSRIMVATYCSETKLGAGLKHREDDLRYVAGLSTEHLNDFLELADENHVVVRALSALQDAAVSSREPRIEEWCGSSLLAEHARIHYGIGVLHAICSGLESRGCRVCVIKSLDHWPDLGSDFDLYTTANEEHVEKAMLEEFNARPVHRSWGDRLANKWNYNVPGLPELIEIHVRFLGQTGEHAGLAARVIARRVLETVDSLEFHVPAPEERIVISALQRVYRHFYFRLCDMIDMAQLCGTGTVDFGELRYAAALAGIWPGVATFLALIQGYVQSYGGEFALPPEIEASAYSKNGALEFKNSFLRVSKVTAAGLYGFQLLQAGRHRDLRALTRLPLLPPLAISAAVAYRLTGNDKGIW